MANERFRELVYPMLEESNYFNPPNEILDAIERAELTLLDEENISQKEFEAINCLIAIYDEILEKEPKEDYISEMIELLKDYL